MPKPIERPESYEVWCTVCERRKDDLVKIETNGWGCEAYLTICRDRLLLTLAAHEEMYARD